MDVRRFVSGTAVILAGWLTVTFFREVPSQRYPKLEKHKAVSSIVPVPVAPVPELDGALLPVSVSN